MQIIKIDSIYDLAILESKIAIADTATSPDKFFDVKVGDHLFYMGLDTIESNKLQYAHVFKISNAYINKIGTFKVGKRTIQYFEFEGIGLHGYSGEPVFNNNGQVVGVIKGLRTKNGVIINRAYSILPIINDLF